MSPLDINQSDKGEAKRIAISAFEFPGNRYAKGQLDECHTKIMGYDDWLINTFFFPVDACIWDVGATWTSVLNRNNQFEEIVPNTIPGPAMEGVCQIGISLFSNRDYPWDNARGMTPMTPKSKMARQPDGSAMEWSADIPVGLGVEELALRSKGYYNKAARQLIYFDTMSTGTNKSKTIDFSKRGKGKKRSKKGKKRAFDVSAGEKLVFWSRNVTGTGDGGLELFTENTITPRVRWFPKENVVQNFRYEDMSEQRWGAQYFKNLRTDAGDGVNELFTTSVANGTKT